MVGVLRVVRVAVLRFVPGDDLTHVLDDGFAFGEILQGEHTLAMHAGATDLNTTGRCGGGSFGHGKNLVC